MIGKEEGMMEDKRTVIYTGPYPEVTIPGNPHKLVKRMVPIEVPAHLPLCAFWRDAETVLDEDAPKMKDGE